MIRTIARIIKNIDNGTACIKISDNFPKQINKLYFLVFSLVSSFF